MKFLNVSYGALCVFVAIASATAVRVETNNHPYFTPDLDSETTEANHNSMICMNIRPQHSVDITQIMGMWHGNEIIMHTQDVPGVYRYNSCVIIYLSDITDQMQLSARDYDQNYNRNYNQNHRYTTTVSPYDSQESNGYNSNKIKYLRLVWTEGDNNVEYTFNYTTHRPGLWTNIGDQRGTFLTLNQYTQFHGSVQVVKAVNDHLVLLFCGSELRSSIYTIVLSRYKDGLSREELHSIHTLLNRRGLSTDTIRQVCSAAPIFSSSYSALLTILSMLCLVNAVKKYY